MKVGKINPRVVRRWAKQRKQVDVVNDFLRRKPRFLFEKTEILHQGMLHEGIDITLKQLIALTR